MIQQIPIPRVRDLETGDIFMFSEYGMEFKVMDKTFDRIYYSPFLHGRNWESVGANSMQRIRITGKAARRYRSRK